MSRIYIYMFDPDVFILHAESRIVVNAQLLLMEHWPLIRVMKILEFYLYPNAVNVMESDINLGFFMIHYLFT
mgnify:CR=1 FL=1